MIIRLIGLLGMFIGFIAFASGIANVFLLSLDSISIGIILSIILPIALGYFLLTRGYIWAKEGTNKEAQNDV